MKDQNASGFGALSRFFGGLALALFITSTITDRRERNARLDLIQADVAEIKSSVTAKPERF